MSSSQKEILLNQLASLSNITPPKPFMTPNLFNNLPMSPNPDLLKALHAINSFSAMQANFNMMANGEQDLLSKLTNPLLPPNLNPLAFGVPKQPFNLDLLSKYELLNSGVNQNVSPASGVNNLLKDRMSFLFPPFMNPMNRNLILDDAEQASLIEKNRGFPFGLPMGAFNKSKTMADKKVITIDDEDEDVMECKPEEFKKNVEKSQNFLLQNKDMKDPSLIQSNNLLKSSSMMPIKDSLNKITLQSIHRKYDSKGNKKNAKNPILCEDSQSKVDNKLKFSSNDLIKRNFFKSFKKKPKKGFLSHRKKHRNQKRREKIVLNCKKCNSRIIILTKKTQIPDHKIKDKLCKSCLFESAPDKENYEKKSGNLLHISNRSKNIAKKIKEEDSESKSDTISRYKEMMFSNTNRILLGENYQAEMPEFLLSKPEKMNEMRFKTIGLLKSHKIWNPSEENARLYDEVYLMICQTYNSSYTHYDFVNIIDQYEGDIKHIKQNLERKEVNLINLLNETVCISGKKRITRSSKNKFRTHANDSN